MRERSNEYETHLIGSDVIGTTSGYGFSGWMCYYRQNWRYIGQSFAVRGEVGIKGTVGNTSRVSFLSKGAYQVGDGTGNIWGTTSQPSPEKGASISVRGTAQLAVSLGGRSLGTVIVESKGG